MMSARSVKYLFQCTFIEHGSSEWCWFRLRNRDTRRNEKIWAVKQCYRASGKLRYCLSSTCFLILIFLMSFSLICWIVVLDNMCNLMKIQLPNMPDEEAVRIFLEFSNSAQAIKAIIDLNGRYFAGRPIRASFYQLDEYSQRKLDTEIKFLT